MRRKPNSIQDLLKEEERSVDKPKAKVLIELAIEEEDVAAFIGEWTDLCRTLTSTAEITNAKLTIPNSEIDLVKWY